MKITNVVSYLTVTVRKIKYKQMNKSIINAFAIMGISMTENNEIRFLTFMFTIKRKIDEKSIDVIVIKQTNKQTNKVKWNINKRP